MEKRFTVHMVENPNRCGCLQLRKTTCCYLCCYLHDEFVCVCVCADGPARRNL